MSDAGLARGGMRESAAELEEYLAPEEPLLAVSTGELYEQSAWHAMAIGTTDRRLVCVGEDGRCVTVGYDAIRTIRTHPVTTRTYRGLGSMLLLGTGALLALLGIVGILALATTVLVPLLALGTVGGIVVVESLRRDTAALERGAVTAVTERVPSDIDGTAVRKQYERLRPAPGVETQLALLVSASVAVLGFVGLLLLVPSGYVVLGLLGIVGGLALVDHTFRTEGGLEDAEIVQNHMTELTISIPTDRSIHVRSHRSHELGRTLSQAAFADGVEPSQLVSSPASSKATDSPEI